ncbi:MAG: hypothetical protein RI897_4553 [Verrucomicrobiota bacterium]|jgi:hypothetical protein
MLHEYHPEHPDRHRLPLTRREFLQRTGLGFGALSLASILGHGETGRQPAPHFAPRARHVVHIFAQGAPSQIDTWDPKPALKRYNGKPLPNTKGLAMPSPFQFEKRGQSGIEVSEVFPKLGALVDDLCVVRSCHTDIPAHEIATIFLNTGSTRQRRPSLGSWVLYGLGSENENLPGYISLRPGGTPPGAASNWQASFLPGNCQGVSINTKNSRIDALIENIRNPRLTPPAQRAQTDLVQHLNQLHAESLQHEAALDARIQSHEMAFRMQTEATDAFDLSKEPASIRNAYGSSPQGKQLLITRRLIERGVRFVQVWAGGWDHHQDLADRLPVQAREIDQPLATFLTDLKQRALFDETLVVWGGEFGRKPVRDPNEEDNPGRDHNAKAFTTVLAGGGVRRGTVYGATDELGMAASENPVHVHDLHATILHLLGFDHKRLTYRYNGRDFRLTDVYGHVIQDILA